MARFKLKNYHWNRPGYVEIMNGAGVQGELDRVARAVKGRADALMPKNGYRTGAHAVMDATRLKMARGRLIYTRTNLAKYQQARHKTLTKALGGSE